MKQVVLTGNDEVYQAAMRQLASQQPYIQLIEAPKIDIDDKRTIDAFGTWWDDQYSALDQPPYVLYVYNVVNRSRVPNLSSWMQHLYSRRASVFFLLVGERDNVEEMASSLERHLPRPTTTGRLLVIQGTSFRLDKGARCFELLLSALLAPSPAVKDLTRLPPATAKQQSTLGRRALFAGAGVLAFCGLLLWLHWTPSGHSGAASSKGHKSPSPAGSILRGQ